MTSGAVPATAEDAWRKTIQFSGVVLVLWIKLTAIRSHSSVKQALHNWAVTNDSGINGDCGVELKDCWVMVVKISYESGSRCHQHKHIIRMGLLDSLLFSEGLI